MESRWMRFERLRKSNGNGGKRGASFFCCILRLIHRNNQCFSYQFRQAHSPPISNRHSKWMVLGYKGLFAVCGLCLIEKRGLECQGPQKFHESNPQEAITDDAGKTRTCARAPLSHPHPGDHLTRGAFFKLLLSRKRQWQLPQINSIMSKAGILLTKKKKNQRPELARPSS